MKYPVSLIFVDIDHFKKINDTLGHSGGDEVLRVISKIMNNSIRQECDWVARFGGEEFIVVLADSNSTNGVVVADRIRSNIENYDFCIDGKNLKVTSSFDVTGIDEFDLPQDAAVLLSSADSGLYMAKQSGRNRVVKVLPDHTKELSDVPSDT